MILTDMSSLLGPFCSCSAFYSVITTIFIVVASLSLFFREIIQLQSFLLPILTLCVIIGDYCYIGASIEFGGKHSLEGPRLRCEAVVRNDGCT